MYTSRDIQVTFNSGAVAQKAYQNPSSKCMYSCLKMLTFLFAVVRVWDVRSGRSIHKLKGHKVILFFEGLCYT